MILAPHEGTAASFDFWHLPGRKTLQHDGERLLLTSVHAHERVRMHLGKGLCHEMPYAYAMAAGAQPESYRRSLDAIVGFMAQREAAFVARTYPRPLRSTLMHMRMLQAHDGVSARASQREIASVL